MRSPGKRTGLALEAVLQLFGFALPIAVAALVARYETLAVSVTVGVGVLVVWVWLNTMRGLFQLQDVDEQIVELPAAVAAAVDRLQLRTTVEHERRLRDSLLGLARSYNDATGRYNASNHLDGLFLEQLQQLTGSVHACAREFEQLARGRFVTDRDDREILDLLVQSASTSIFGLSDVRGGHTALEEWWTSDQGQEFIEHNVEQAKAGLNVRRVFLLPDDLDPSDRAQLLGSLMHEQASAGIHVRYLFARQLGHADALDGSGYMIIDEIVLAEAFRPGERTKVDVVMGPSDLVVTRHQQMMGLFGRGARCKSEPATTRPGSEVSD